MNLNTKIAQIKKSTCKQVDFNLFLMVRLFNT